MPVFVNDIEINDDEVHREMQHHPADSLAQARAQAARTLVVRALLLEEAAHLELVAPGRMDDLKEDEINSVIDQLLVEEISIPEADQETCRRYYRKHKDIFCDKKTGKPVPFELVEEHIRDYLHTSALRVAISAYIDALASKSKISGIELPLH